MKQSISIFFCILLPLLAFGQTTGKVGNTSTNVINKIGGVPVESIGKIGDISTPVLYKSCKEIKAANPNAADGIYTIDPDGEGGADPFECYCDMTTDGGGWTLVGYYRNPATENAPDDLDNRDYAYFMKARNNATYGKSEYIANPDSEGAWTDWRVLGGVEWPIEFAVILDQSSWSTEWEAYAAKTIYRVKNRNVMPNYGTTQDLTTGDNLYYKFNPTSGWTDVGSTSSSLTYMWYPRTSSGSYLTLFHESNRKYIDGGEPTNNQYGAYYGNGIPGGNNTWHHSAHILVR
jgi:hypothetical protein